MTVFRNKMSEKVPYLPVKLIDQETIVEMLKLKTTVLGKKNQIIYFCYFCAKN